MRFLHTADWHLGRPFHHASLEADQKHALDQIVAYAKEHKVDAVVVAGDVYDRAVPPRWAVELLDEVLHRLCVEIAIPVIMIPGNHDSAERLGFGSRQLQQANLHIVAQLEQAAQPVVIDTAKTQTAFYCLPFSEPVQVSQLANATLTTHDQAHTWLVEQIKLHWDANAVNVLVSHCFVAGAEESESERRLSVGGTDSVSVDPLLDFSYVALGHLHSPQKRSEEHVRYSGSLLKYSFSEVKQQKSVTLVEIDEHQQTSYVLLPLQPLHDVRVIQGEMDELLAAGQTAPDADDYLLAKLTNKGVLLNAMARLREVYPNILHLEKPGLLGTGDRKTMNREKLKRGELEMFRDFYEQMTGDELTTTQETVISQTLEKLKKDSVGEA